LTGRRLEEPEMMHTIKMIEIRRRLLPWLRTCRPLLATPYRPVGYPLHAAYSAAREG
jgi:hypothetical protein